MAVAVAVAMVRQIAPEMQQWQRKRKEVSERTQQRGATGSEHCGPAEGIAPDRTREGARTTPRAPGECARAGRAVVAGQPPGDGLPGL